MRRIVVLVVVAGMLGTAASAGAATWIVWAGPSGLLKKPPPGAPKTAEPSEFYPSSLRVHAGDSVTFKTREGHTVTMLGKRKPSSFHLITPAPNNETYSGINDSLGNPFWFNGKPKFVYSVGDFFNPAGGTTVTSTSVFRNRAIFGPDPHNPPGSKSSVTLHFPKAGTYRILCFFHYPVMKETVTVVPRGKSIPSPSAVAARVAAQIQQSVTTAKALTKTTAPANTVVAGVTGKSVDLIQFFPAKLKVPVGTTVTFLNRSKFENHNEVFGGPKTPWVKNYLQNSDQGPPGPVGPEEIYGTEPPDAWQYDGTNHGNGFLVTPVTDTLPLTPFGSKAAVTFTKAGTFHFFCQIHGPEMAGDIVVG